ncbi:Transcription factor PIF3 [Hordeum vulgare]|nr:Transcription factor PIF3 [Hordeum vulgare]
MPADGAGTPWKEEDQERGAADAVTALRSVLMPPPLLLTDKAGLHGHGPPVSEAGESSVVTMAFGRPCGGSNEAQTPHVSDAAGDDRVLLPLSSKEGQGREVLPQRVGDVDHVVGVVEAFRRQQAEAV